MGFRGPVHPALVHFPLTFLLTSYGIDVFCPLQPSMPTSILSYLPQTAELQRMSYLLLSLGLLSVFPTIASGIVQADKMFFSTPNANMQYTAKGQTTIAHAVTNYIVVGGSAWMWWHKRSVGATGKQENWETTVSVLLGLTMMASAALGHQLVYRYGVGFGASKANGKMK